MSDEARMNPELRKLEANLGRVAIPAASLNRDELMYQSGWAAAMTSLGHEAAPVFSISKPTASQPLIWQASTLLATAAAALLGIMLLNPSPNQGGVETTVAHNVVTLDAELVEPNLTEPAEVPSVVAVTPDLIQLVMNPDCKTLHAGMVVGPNFPAAAEPGLKTPDSPLSEDLTPPMTQQQLLNELLPNRIDRSPKWSLFGMGGNS